MVDANPSGEETFVILDRWNEGLRQLANRTLRWFGARAREGVPSQALEPIRSELGFYSHAMRQDVSRLEDQPSQRHRARAEKISAWRRRVLERKGARMYSKLGADAGACSFAMLDASGMVISWRDLHDSGGRGSDGVLDRDVSQFYVAEDVTSGLPQRDLQAAALTGRSSQQGWCLRPGGGVFWGTTVIEVVRLADRRIQGFCFITRRSWEPSGNFVPRPDRTADALHEVSRQQPALG